MGEGKCPTCGRATATRHRHKYEWRITHCPVTRKCYPNCKTEHYAEVCECGKRRKE
jgi:hypothetical protein